MLALAFIWRQFHGVPTGEVKSLIDIEHRLHPVVSGGHGAESLRRIAQS